MSKMKYPLVLISQLPRAGGTLLSQLFDGHSSILAYPGEIRIGRPKWSWVNIDLNEPFNIIFNLLTNPNTYQFMKIGYSKQALVGMNYATRFSFNFSFTTQYRLFLEYLNGVSPLTQRQILNAYFYSYFKTLRGEASSSKIITGFTPVLSLVKNSLCKFFDDYPDGKLISILREPIGWYASMSFHVSPLAKNIDLNKLYVTNLDSLLDNKKKYSNLVLILNFHDIIKDTEMVMKTVCDFLNINFEEILLTPTFEKQPIEADSNFIESVKVGIVTDVLNREDKLQPDQLQKIREFLLPEYYRVKKLLEL